MKSSKIFYIIFIICIAIYFTANAKLQSNNESFEISNPQNLFYQKLNHAILISGIKTNNFVYRDFISEVEFSTENQTKVILSTKISPYFQIDALQRVLKKAKIDSRTPRLVNLGAPHPYATF